MSVVQKNKKINYFDLGAHQGNTVSLFLALTHKVRITNFNVYAFEPCLVYNAYCTRFFAQDKRVKLFQCAISDSDGEVSLYYAENSVGNSIFSTKENIINLDSFKKNTFQINVPEFLKQFPDLLSRYVSRYGHTMTGQTPSGTPIAVPSPEFSAVNHESVKSILFSNWLKNNVPDLETSINILKVNLMLN